MQYVIYEISGRESPKPWRTPVVEITLESNFPAVVAGLRAQGETREINILESVLGTYQDARNRESYWRYHLGLDPRPPLPGDPRPVKYPDREGFPMTVGKVKTIDGISMTVGKVGDDVGE
jgi:hypothetical protein